MNKKMAWVVAITIILLAGFATFWYIALRSENKQPTQPATQTQQNQVNNQASGSPNQNNPKIYEVFVYFSKHPQSDNDPSATFPVKRTSTDLGLARVAIIQLLAGPTAAEKTEGYFSQARLRVAASNCGGEDFTIHIINGTATLKFCKPFDHVGEISDGQADSEIKATLKLFSSVSKVIILNYQGNCEFDLSGQNLCLQQ